jgi:hypothetical protein
MKISFGGIRTPERQSQDAVDARVPGMTAEIRQTSRLLCQLSKKIQVLNFFPAGPDPQEAPQFFDSGFSGKT